MRQDRRLDPRLLQAQRRYLILGQGLSINPWYAILCSSGGDATHLKTNDSHPNHQQRHLSHSDY